MPEPTLTPMKIARVIRSRAHTASTSSAMSSSVKGDSGLSERP
jgi:hypothetical protein